MKKIYKFDYDLGEASCTIVVDTDVFTKEKALETLTFFTWDYDVENDEIEEAVKKYALFAIEKATEGFSLFSLKQKQFEGFHQMDGSTGIELVDVEGIYIQDELLEIESVVSQDT